MSTADPLATCLAAALEIVDSTDAMTREHAAHGFSQRHKSDRSFVTDVDFAVERFIRDEIGRRFPDHGIVGEELDDVAPDAELRWVVDPIDGTMSLTHGIPLYGTLIALLESDRPVLGVVSLPAIRRRAWAARGLGAFLDGARITLRDLDAGLPFEDEVIAIGERRQFLSVGLEAHFDRLMAAHPGVRVYCDCFGHLLAFGGNVGAMVDYGLRIWDMAASRIVMEEAGGAFEIVSERDTDGQRRYDVVMGKPRVVDWVKRVTLGTNTPTKRL